MPQLAIADQRELDGRLQQAHSIEQIHEPLAFDESAGVADPERTSPGLRAVICPCRYLPEWHRVWRKLNFPGGSPGAHETFCAGRARGDECGVAQYVPSQPA